MSEFKLKPHGPWVPGTYKPYCLNCGLVKLNNEFTAWAIRMGCNNQDHPQYEQQRQQAGKR